MDLCNITEVRALLGAHGFTFSKAMGQNFLIDGSVPRRIAEESGANENSLVLEIGPGVGCLTAELAMRAGRVLAVELDTRLRPVHDITLSAYPNVEIIYGDVMKLDLGELVAARSGGLTPSVCANLPYNITSPVLTKLLTSGLFDSVTVMVQLEVARRIAAAPGTADYGAFSLLCRYYTEPELLFRVPASSFEPRPKVESAVVRMAARPLPPVSTDREMLFRVIRAAFNQRRKTLSNALTSGFPELEKGLIREAISAAGLDERIRGEALSMEEFASVADNITEISGK